MRRALSQLGVVAALALLCGCGHDDVTGHGNVITTAPDGIVGSGVVVSQSRDASGFTAVTVTGPLRLVLEQAASESLEVTAEDNVLPLVQTEVRGDRLFLGLGAHTRSLAITREIVCRVRARQIREVAASGAARVEISGVEGEQLSLTLSGAATAVARGNATRLKLDVSGASRLDAGALLSRDAGAAIDGASYALVRAADSLVVTVSGASVLEYLGDPVVTPVVSGASVVRRVGP